MSFIRSISRRIMRPHSVVTNLDPRSQGCLPWRGGTQAPFHTNAEMWPERRSDVQKILFWFRLWNLLKMLCPGLTVTWSYTGQLGTLVTRANGKKSEDVKLADWNWRDFLMTRVCPMVTTDWWAVFHGHRKTSMWFWQVLMSKEVTSAQEMGKNIQVPNNQTVHSWTPIISLGDVTESSAVQKRELPRM